LKKIAIDGVIMPTLTYQLVKRQPNDEKGNPVVSPLLFDTAPIPVRKGSPAKRKNSLTA